jgi:hypothetical protein
MTTPHPPCATRINPNAGHQCCIQHACPVSTRKLDKWLGRNDHLGTGSGHVYLISCMPCHVHSYTYITKVNRTKHKKSRDALGKRITHGPPLFSFLKEAALSDLHDSSDSRQRSSDLSSLASYFRPPFPLQSLPPLFHWSLPPDATPTQCPSLSSGTPHATSSPWTPWPWLK